MRLHKRFEKAMANYTPQRMVPYLARADNGTVYVEREKIIHDSDDKLGFQYMLRTVYHSVWKDIERRTVYFEVTNYNILCGTYHMDTGEKTPSFNLRDAKNKRSLYTYSQEDFDMIREFIVRS